MFLPIRTDRRLRHTPWVNYALVAVNIVIYLITRDHAPDSPIVSYYLHPGSPQLFQFVTYVFLHASGMHVLGNMLFLFVFGNNVEDRMGHVGYLCFYLAGGVLSGLGHVLIEGDPVIGASGAVAAVSGAYLALFPRTNVTIGYFFFVIVGAIEVSSLVVILLYVAYDVVHYIVDPSNVAYMAHLSGYVFGFAVGMGLLFTRLLAREPYDMISLLEHRRRRVAFTALTREGYAPWELNKPPEPGKVKVAERREPSRVDTRVMDMRARVSELLSQQRLADAADMYARVLDLDGSQVMPRQQQLDLANQLMGEGRHLLAARAYELYLSTFRLDGHRDEVELMLGLIYVRYLDRKQRGKELLTALLPRLTDPERVQLVRQALGQIGR